MPSVFDVLWLFATNNEIVSFLQGWIEMVVLEFWVSNLVKIRGLIKSKIGLEVSSPFELKVSNLKEILCDAIGEPIAVLLLELENGSVLL